MAVMKFREDNLVQWRGWRPGHNGTQILRLINLSASDQIYEVGAGVTFHLTDWHLSIVGNVDAVAQLVIQGVAPGRLTLAYLGFAGSFTAEPGVTVCQNLVYPIEMIAGEEIYLFTTEIARGYLHGWTE